MRSKKFKFLLGALIIALVVSILPMGIFANAVKEESKITQERKVKLITIERAERIALRSVQEEGVKLEELKVLDAIDYTKLKTPSYYFIISSSTRKYFIDVDPVTGEIFNFVESLLSYVDKKKLDTGVELEKDKNEAKKDAIKTFQDEMKVANNQVAKKKAIAKFKEAKDEIKAHKKEEKNKLKEEKNKHKEEEHKQKEEKKPTKKDEKPINEIKYLTEKKAKEIAIDKFKNKNVKPESLEIELRKDKNPPLYIVEAYDEKNRIEYELVIHATTGIILEYERALY